MFRPACSSVERALHSNVQFIVFTYPFDWGIDGNELVNAIRMLSKTVLIERNSGEVSV